MVIYLEGLKRSYFHFRWFASIDLYMSRNVMYYYHSNQHHDH